MSCLYSGAGVHEFTGAWASLHRRLKEPHGKELVLARQTLKVMGDEKLVYTVWVQFVALELQLLSGASTTLRTRFLQRHFLWVTSPLGSQPSSLILRFLEASLAFGGLDFLWSTPS